MPTWEKPGFLFSDPGTICDTWKRPKKKPPLTQKASRGPVVALSPTREVPMHYHFVRYHNGGGGWKRKNKFLDSSIRLRALTS